MARVKRRNLAKQLAKYQLEMIVWDDHAGPYNDVDASEVKMVLRATVGWVVREDESTVVIAGTLDDDSSTFSDMNALGKGLILMRKELT